MRLVVYDRTCVATRGHLTPVWAAGAWLFRRLGRIDAVYSRMLRITLRHRFVTALVCLLVMLSSLLLFRFVKIRTSADNFRIF